jgi:cyclic pyranopterin phosphate synthase
LSWDDLLWVTEISSRHLGIRALRVTGGEPTLRPGLVEWLARVRQRANFEDLSMTTNGQCLAAVARPLAQAGLGRVNVSVDSLDPARFAAITRGGSLERVLTGIEAAREASLSVKINAVLLSGLTMRELADFVQFSDAYRLVVRFIEAMPLGDDKQWWSTHFVSAGQARTRLRDLGITLVPESDSPGRGPATVFRVQGTEARIGFISQMSRAKCATCNKLRITSDGKLRPCLLASGETDLLPDICRRDADAFAATVSNCFRARPGEYDFGTMPADSFGRSMKAIGG